VTCDVWIPAYAGMTGAFGAEPPAPREARDLLLPRLISGELSVEGLPIPEEK
jgi:hypothetical protein